MFAHKILIQNIEFCAFYHIKITGLVMSSIIVCNQINNKMHVENANEIF